MTQSPMDTTTAVSSITPKAMRSVIREVTMWFLTLSEEVQSQLVVAVASPSNTASGVSPPPVMS